MAKPAVCRDNEEGAQGRKTGGERREDEIQSSGWVDRENIRSVKDFSFPRLAGGLEK